LLLLCYSHFVSCCLLLLLLLLLLLAGAGAGRGRQLMQPACVLPLFASYLLFTCCCFFSLLTLTSQF